MSEAPTGTPTAAGSAALHNLLAELAAVPVNVLRVKTICLQNPGIIANSGGLRVRIWSLLLLGNEGGEGNKEELGTPETRCGEQQVLDADVRRTRADMEEFRRPAWRKSLSDVLQTFCLMHHIAYKQGMNEILAPFVWSMPPETGPGVGNSVYELYESFIYRYLERFFLVDDSMYLFKSFRYFHLLLLYHDPQLAIHLHHHDFVPELYAPSWLLTLYSRALPIPHVLRLWDMMLSVDDPSFSFFVGLALIGKMRARLLVSEAGTIPEVITDLVFHSEKEIDQVVKSAYALYQATPRSFCRNLRLCCVSTAELAPAASTQKARQEAGSSGCFGVPGEDIKMLDDQMAMQSVRACVAITPRELVAYLSPGAAGGGAGGRQSVVIDLRSSFEARETGGGTVLNASVCLEPEFLDSDDFPLWLEHFDKIKGHNIIIIDTPPVKANGTALWKRLLFGEGDGGIYNGSFRYGSSPASSKFSWSQRDRSSPFCEVEAAAAADDSDRPAVRLALELQAQSFPYVSVTTGFPALVEHLIATRGTPEQFLEGFDQKKWVTYLKSTGRLDGTVSALAGGRAARSELSAPAGIILGELSFDFDAAPTTKTVQQQVSELSELARLDASLVVAERLGHKHMHVALLERMERQRKKEALTNQLIDSVIESYM